MTCTWLRLCFLFAVLSSFVAPDALAQVATGAPPFGTFGGGPFDQVDLANLNVHFRIPVIAKAGRGLPFTYDLSYDSSVWTPVTSGSTQAWQPVTNWGWRGQTEAAMGYITNSSKLLTCHEFVNGRWQTVYRTETYNFVYHDSFGVAHAFSNFYNACYDEYLDPSTAKDGSGLTLTSGTVYTKYGQAIVPGQGSGTATDRNGNQISTNGSSFTDTLGTTALSVSGSAPNPVYFTYTSPSTTQVSVQVNYSSYTVKTNFGCSGITEYPATSVPLVSSIVLPDGTSYAIIYEPTPGTPGDVTGRIQSISLPTGGTISYSYSGGSGGIVCADGSTATLTRTTPDGAWSYAHSESGTAWTTTVQDPQGNQTMLDFQGLYETERQAYQGSTSGTLLTTVVTCYNGNTSNCNTTAVTLPITQKTATVQLPGGLQCKHNYLYNSFGQMTEADDYDYANGAPGSLIRKRLITFSAVGNVQARVTASTYDGQSHLVAQATYTYDQGSVTTTSGTPQHISVSGSRANLTTVSYLVHGSTTLNKTFTYYDTGNIKQATDLNGAVTGYTYGACGNSFPTSISEPLSLSRSETWNCTGGVETSVTDENGKTVTTTYNDPYFWRPNSVQDPASNVTNISYNNATSIETSLLFNGGSSTVDVLATADALGRPYIVQTKEGPSSGTYDSTETDYDSLGRPSRRTLPYSGAAGQSNSSAPATNVTYDTLGRRTGLTDSGGRSVTFSYSQNDTYRTVGPAPTGENTKRSQFEYDSIGRLISVCEITSGSGSGTCSQTSSVTGYWTEYAYDSLNDLTGVTQNAQAAPSNQQTRSYTYDDMRRLTSETNPESGATTYVYDSDLTCGTSSGNLVKKVDAVGNTTCYAYDALHRNTSVTYSGPYASSTPRKYFIYDAATVNSIAMVNTKARLAEAYTCFSPCTTKITDLGFSYTARGEVSDVYESTPHSSGYYHVAASYWANGRLNQLSGLSGLPTITYNVDGEGRVYSASASSGQNPLASTAYNVASQLTQVNLGSSDSDAFSYDSNTDRMTQYTFNVNGQSVVGALTWNAMGTLHSLNITDPFNSSDNQSCSYSHDDLVRIASVNCGSVWSQTFSYDAFGNISKSGTNSFQPTYSWLTNHMTAIGSSTPTYDANGNVTNDFLHTYAWDAVGRPVTIDGVGVTYDALGRMVEQNKSGTYSDIVYAPGGAKLAIMNGQTLTKAFVPLVGGSMAVYNSNGLAYYRHSDWLGSPRFASTPARAMYFDTAYAPFGEPYAQTGTTDLSFTSMNQDTVSNLYDFPAREYGIQGRWPSPDQAGLVAVVLQDPQSLNRYSYVANVPTNIKDPSGLLCRVGVACAWGGWANGNFPTAAATDGIMNFWSGWNLSPDLQTFMDTANFPLINNGGVLVPEDPNNDAAIEWQHEHLADEISNASNSSDGSNWDAIYNHLVYYGTVGGNADFVWVTSLSPDDTLTLGSLGLPDNLQLSTGGCEVWCRIGSIPSIHYNNSMFHLDLANIFWGFGLGLFLHGAWDFGIGSIMGTVPFGP
jgi:RHS repeat-associated protein